MWGKRMDIVMIKPGFHCGGLRFLSGRKSGRFPWRQPEQDCDFAVFPVKKKNRTENVLIFAQGNRG